MASSARVLGSTGCIITLICSRCASYLGRTTTLSGVTLQYMSASQIWGTWSRGPGTSCGCAGPNRSLRSSASRSPAVDGARGWPPTAGHKWGKRGFWQSSTAAESQDAAGWRIRPGRRRLPPRRNQCYKQVRAYPWRRRRARYYTSQVGHAPAESICTAMHVSTYPSLKPFSPARPLSQSSRPIPAVAES